VIAAACLGLAATLALAGAPADGTDDEGPQTTITGRVESIRAEQDGRVPVSVMPYAQMYFLYRSEPRFDELLQLLKDAQSGRRPVKCTFRRYSGRIVTVEWADQDEQPRQATAVPGREDASRETPLFAGVSRRSWNGRKLQEIRGSHGGLASASSDRGSDP
jgi:hypothetical protein